MGMIHRLRNISEGEFAVMVGFIGSLFIIGLILGVVYTSDKCDQTDARNEAIIIESQTTDMWGYYDANGTLRLLIWENDSGDSIASNNITLIWNADDEGILIEKACDIGDGAWRQLKLESLNAGD